MSDETIRMERIRGLRKRLFFNILLLLSASTIIFYFNDMFAAESQPAEICEISPFYLPCENLKFNHENNIFEFTLYNAYPKDFIVTALSLIPVPGGKVNCWLDLNEIPPELKHTQLDGLYIRKNQKNVHITLNCTEFEQKDVEKGKWRFNITRYFILDGEPTPPTSSLDYNLGLVGYVQINKPLHTIRDSGMYQNPLYLSISLFIIACYSLFQLEKEARKILWPSLVHDGGGILHWLFTTFRFFTVIAGYLFTIFRFFIVIIWGFIILLLIYYIEVKGSP